MRINLTKAVLVMAVLFSGVLPALAGNDSTNPPVQPQQEKLPVEGIYVTEMETVTALENGIEIFSPRPCAELMPILQAGQWRLVDSIFFSLDPNQVFGITWGVLKRGEEALSLSAKGGAGDCTAVITPAIRQRLTASGAETFDTEAMVYPLMCMAGEFYSEAEGDDIDGAILLSIYDLGDNTSVMISLDVPMVEGTHEITDPGDMAVRFTRSELIFPHDQLTGLPMEGEFNLFEPAYNQNVTGTVEITSVQPLQGVMTLTDLQNNRGEALELTASFECATVVGADTGLLEELE